VSGSWGVERAPDAVSGPGCKQMMPFLYGAERKVLQMQTEARLARTVSLKSRSEPKTGNVACYVINHTRSCLLHSRHTPGAGEYKMTTDHRTSTIHNKGNKMGKNMGECNRRKPNHDCENVSVKQRRRDWVSWPMWSTKLEILIAEEKRDPNLRDTYNV
jgi:hypothetical protein